MPGPDGAPGEKGETVSLLNRHFVTLYFLIFFLMYDFVSWGRIISLTMDMYLCESFLVCLKRLIHLDSSEC